MSACHLFPATSPKMLALCFRLLFLFNSMRKSAITLLYFFSRKNTKIHSSNIQVKLAARKVLESYRWFRGVAESLLQPHLGQKKKKSPQWKMVVTILKNRSKKE